MDGWKRWRNGRYIQSWGSLLFALIGSERKIDTVSCALAKRQSYFIYRFRSDLFVLSQETRKLVARPTNPNIRESDCVPVFNMLLNDDTG